MGENTTASPRLFPEELNILYDSKCSLYIWGMERITQRDVHKRIKWTDIESPDFNPRQPENGNITYSKALKSLYAVQQNGQVVKGLQVLFLAYHYTTGGVGWFIEMTTWPVIGLLLEICFRLLTRYRTMLTRGSTRKELIRLRAHQRIIDECKASAYNMKVYQFHNCRRNSTGTGTLVPPPLRRRSGHL